MTTGTPASADVTTVEGDATSLLLGVLAPPSPLIGSQASGSATAPQTGYGPVGTGELPPIFQNGNLLVQGADCAAGTLLPLPPTPGVTLDIGLLEACTRGGLVGTHDGFAQSQARVVDLELLGADLGVITSTCLANGDDAVANTSIIGSPLLPENPAPGQQVTIPVQVLPPPVPPLQITVTLNEQVANIVEPSPGNPIGVNEITVNALHVNILGIEIIVAQSHCRAEGPDVNATTTTSSTSSTTSTTMGTTTTTEPDGTTTTTEPDGTTTTTEPDGTTTTTEPDGGGPTTTGPGGGGGNNNNNNNSNNNSSNNSNNNTSNNNNSNSNTNNQNQTNNQSQTQTGGNNSNVNENVINILGGSNFDVIRGGGSFTNDGGGSHGGPGSGRALARAGANTNRLTGVALLLLVVGGVLVFSTRTVTAEAAAVPATRRRRWTWR